MLILSYFIIFFYFQIFNSVVAFVFLAVPTRANIPTHAMQLTCRCTHTHTDRNIETYHILSILNGPFQDVKWPALNNVIHS